MEKVSEKSLDCQVRAGVLNCKTVEGMMWDQSTETRAPYTVRTRLKEQHEFSRRAFGVCLDKTAAV